MRNVNSIIRRIETSLSNRQLTAEEERLCSMLRPADALLYAAYVRGNMSLGRLVMASDSLPNHWVWHRPLQVNVWFALRLARLTWDALQEAQGVSGDTEPVGWSAEKGCWDSEGHYGFTAEQVNKMAYAAGCKVGSSKYNWLAKRLVRLYLDPTQGPCSFGDNYAINDEGYMGSRRIADVKRVPVRLLGAYYKGIERAGCNMKRVDILALGRVCAATAWILVNGDARFLTTYEERGRQLAWEAYRIFRSASDAEKAMMLPANLAWNYVPEGWGDGRVQVGTGHGCYRTLTLDEDTVTLRCNTVATFTHKVTGEVVVKELSGFESYLSAYDQEVLVGSDYQSLDYTLSYSWHVSKRMIHPSHVVDGVVMYDNLDSIEGLAIPRCWFHDTEGYNGRSLPYYAKLADSQAEWNAYVDIEGLVRFSDGLHTQYSPEGNPFYIVDGQPYLLISGANNDRDCDRWLAPITSALVAEKAARFSIQRTGKYIVGSVLHKGRERTDEPGTGRAGGRYKYRKVTKWIPFIISTQHGIELSGSNATWPAMKIMIGKQLEKQARAEAIEEIRSGKQAVKLSLLECKEAGFCLSGTRGFLKEKMPYVARLVQPYSSWSDVPEDVMTMVQEVQIDWCGYSSYLNRLA